MNELTLVERQVGKLANRLSLELDEQSPRELTNVLKATAFKGQVSDAQMSALLIVAGQYGLNPWTKEIFAFPDPQNGIVPVVSVDGWSRIINEHPQYDGIEFELSGSGNDMAMTCRIYRKDRSRPTAVTEYLEECKRDTKPWRSHPRRMLRHKAEIQCARLAFGFAGIHDADEAERIIESGRAPEPAEAVDPTTGEIRPLTPTKRAAPAAAAAATPTRHPPVQDVEDAQVRQPAAAAAPMPQPPAAGATGTLASDGHKANLANRARAAGLDLDGLLSEMGAELATLTIEQFDQAKAEILRRVG